MTIQTIWTALPTAYDANYYYFSVFASHRLSGVPAPSTLADYPIGPPGAPTNWALAMESLVLEVSFDGGTSYQPAEKIPPGQPRFWATLSPGLWSRVFPGATVVDSYVPQAPSALALRTYRAVQLAQTYDNLYSQVVQTSATDHPPVSAPIISDLVSSVGHFNDPIVVGAAFVGGLWAILQSTFPPRGDGPPANNQRVYIDWLQQNVAGHFSSLSPLAQELAIQHYLAWRFYRRDVSSQYGPRNPALVKKPAVPEPEFHKLVGMLANHPTLLRKLGFVVDFRTARSPNVAPQGLLQVRVDDYRGMLGTDPRFPQTLYQTNSLGFFARASGPSDHFNGMLIPRGYSIVQVDVDGHAQKMIGYAATAANSAKASPSATESLPARRSGGLTLMQDDRVAKTVIPALGRVDNLNNTMDNNPPNDPTNPVQVDVTDVTRGFRVDVWDGSGVWKSLCRREGTDVVSGGASVPLAAADVEGIVSALGGSQGAPDADPTEQNTLYVHEALFGWDGWSLCAQRPGRTLGQKNSDPNQVPVLGFVANHAPPGYTVTSEYKATHKSLPRLRYGHAYRFRVRLVDLAGNSLPYTNEASVINEVTSSLPATFIRYEPVAPPALVLRRVPTLGESLETVVIRSNPDPVTDLTLIVNGNNATAYSATAPAIAAGFLPICERHMVAPKTSQIMAETHEMLDGLPALTAFRVSAKEAGTLTGGTVYNIDTGTEDPLPPGELAFAFSDGRTPPPPAPANPGDPLPAGTLVLHTLDQVTVPYLPDPLARGVTLQFPASSLPPLDAPLPNVTRAPWVFDPGGWPRIHSMRLIVNESVTPKVTYAWIPTSVTIGLPPATLTTIRYSSTPDAAQAAKTAVWNEIGADPAGQTAALNGTNWLLSPYRELQLVHAVQRPLLIPSFMQSVLVRDVGQTFVEMFGAIQVDGRSTVHVDVNATWVDPYDDANDKTGPHTYLFSDPMGMTDPFTGHKGRAFELPAQYTDTVLNFGFSAAFVVPQKHEFGDTKHRWVIYSPDATTRYREYFPPAVTANADNITTKGKTVILNVLSSKRPAPLEVLYAVPTFKWEKSADGNAVTRKGRGIRVYLSRPWFLTGVDEMVGVCLQPSAMIDDSLAKFTSEWGRDPVWTSTGVTEPLQPEHFTNRVMTTPEPPEFDPAPPPWSTGPFALAEDNSLSVGVIGFFPEYNPARKLWFVDIEMDSGTSYFPFVRLALARFQPHSVWPGMPNSQHLSRVTRTEFLQLVPDRVASIAYMGGRLLVVTVSGVGAFNVLPGAQTPGDSHKITAQVQQRPLGSTNDLLWTNLGSEIVLGLDAIEPTQAVWLGRMFLPTVGADQLATQEFRLLVKETEAYPADVDVAEGATGGVASAERLVYASGIPLTL
jgi:hypothetical protein